jgi:hypothetical protein
MPLAAMLERASMLANDLNRAPQVPPDFDTACMEFLHLFRDDPEACSAAIEHPLEFSVFRWDLSASATLRFHVWGELSDSNDFSVDHRHDHRWRLRSYVLCGQLTEHELQFAPAVTIDSDDPVWELAEIIQSNHRDVVRPTGQLVSVVSDTSFTVRAGESYILPPGEFHWTEPGLDRPLATMVSATVELDQAPRTLITVGSGGRPVTERRTIDVERRRSIISPDVSPDVFMNGCGYEGKPS